MPWARRIRSSAWFAPKRRTSRSRGPFANCPIVSMLIARSAAAALGPTPHKRSTGIGARKAVSSPGGTTQMPFGLARSVAILATSLFVATPIEQGDGTARECAS